MLGRKNTPPVEIEESKPKGFDDFDLRLGDVMRGERATMGKSLLDVQRELKIKANYIAAIENADPAAFETPGFVAGYVRSYARYLGLDPEWAYKRFCDEGEFETVHGMSPAASANRIVNLDKSKQRGSDPFADPNVRFVPPSPAVLSRLEPAAIGSFLVIAMLLSVILYGGYAVFREVQKVQFAPVAQTPSVFSEAIVIDGGASVSAAETDTAGYQMPDADALDRLYRPEPLEAPVLVARDGPIVTLDPSEVGTLPGIAEAALDLAFQDSSVAAVPEVSDVESAIVQVLAELPAPIHLFAVRPSWIRVQGADGTVIFEKIMDAGETYEVPLLEDIATLRAGNAGSVYFSVGDDTFGPIGTSAEVVKNLELVAADLMSAFPHADPDLDADLARFIAVAEANSN